MDIHFDPVVLKLIGILKKALPQDDPERRKPDISTAKSMLDWSPKIRVEEGLNKTIAYFDNLLREEAKAAG